jgi:hypothetical protein
MSPRFNRFILATEILTSPIKRNPDIRGITLDGTEYLNSLYDTSLTLENDHLKQQ